MVAYQLIREDVRRRLLTALLEELVACEHVQERDKRNDYSDRPGDASKEAEVAASDQSEPD
jgi:hypothetical protein